MHTQKFPSIPTLCSHNTHCGFANQEEKYSPCVEIRGESCEAYRMQYKILNIQLGAVYADTVNLQ